MTKNFTVIGNMLFVHFEDNAARKQHEAVIEVPYEIYRRLVTINNSVIISVNGMYYVSGITPITILMFNNKPFIVFMNDRPVEPNFSRYYYCIYLLKDI